MNVHTHPFYPNCKRPHLWFAAALLFWLFGTASLRAQYEGISGYALAKEKSEVASSETGVIAKIFVSEGDFVQQGQPLVQLDDEALRWQLELAQHEANNPSELEATRKRIQVLTMTVSKLTELVKDGNARPSELQREQLELETSHAIYQQKLHEFQLKQIQVQRVKSQLEKRTVVAPFDGQVARLYRRLGEFVSPNTPEIATLVDTSQLVVEFQVPISSLKSYQAHQSVNLRMGDRAIKGNVDFVGVLADQGSQTVPMKVSIDNSNLKAIAGTDCVLITPFE